MRPQAPPQKWNFCPSRNGSEPTSMISIRAGFRQAKAGGAFQAAEKPHPAVILSEAKDLALPLRVSYAKNLALVFS